MTPTRRPGCRYACLTATSAAAVAVSFAVGACESSSGGRQDLPSLRDIRREQRIPAEIAHTLEEAPVKRTPLRVERLDFSLDDSLDEALAALDTSGLSPAISGSWRVNGMRVGVLKSAAAHEFAKELPEMSGGNVQIVVPSSLPVPLLRSPPTVGPVAVDLTVPPRPVREVVLSGGRIQLLVEVIRDAMNRPILIFTPHHFVPQQTLAVRSAEEKQLDGRRLDELALAVLLGRDEALVIALDVPPSVFLPVPVERPLQQAKSRPAATPLSAPAGATPNEEEPPADELQQLPPVEDRLGSHLGRALLAASRYGRPIQMVYVIRLAE